MANENTAPTRERTMPSISARIEHTYDIPDSKLLARASVTVGGTFAVQEVMSRYDVGKYLGKLGMEDIAESLGIEVPETEAPKEEAETGETSDTDETEHVVYETDGAEDADDTEDGEAAQQ